METCNFLHCLCLTCNICMQHLICKLSLSLKETQNIFIDRFAVLLIVSLKKFLCVIIEVNVDLFLVDTYPPSHCQILYDYIKAMGLFVRDGLVRNYPCSVDKASSKLVDVLPVT